MSKTIDEKVVSMQFDNAQFEKNVSTSMSTIDRLKQSLNFDGAGKGLENIAASVKNIDMNSLGNAVESVRVKFSALDVVGVTALANITNSAVNAGKKLAESLSVDQISAGWDKFSKKTTSVATLVAQGNAIEDVNAQLDSLNWFTDETSYNFTDMVDNIAKFTATGKGLTESINAMEGIATWAALSGQNATNASRAMYQLSQALSAGFMRKEDWKSIQNVSMDTEEFRQKTLEAAVALETLKDNGDGTYTSLINKSKEATNFTKTQFVESLTTGAWFTSDVMMKVFGEYSSAVSSIYAVTEEKGMLASEVIDEIHEKANELKTDAMSDSEAIDTAIRELGYTLEDGTLMFDSFGLKAFEAGQKARTFQDAIDSVKDAVSTGWMNTFELLFGDAEEATKLWTDVANQLWDIFASGGETRNEFLSNVLNSKWDQLVEKIEQAGVSAETFESKIKETAKEHGIAIGDLIKEYGSLDKVILSGKLSKGVIVETIKKLAGSFTKVSDSVKVTTDKLEHFQELVNKVVRGEFGNGLDRIEALTKAGENYATVQDLVNKVWERNGHSWKDTTITAEDLTGVINDLSESELQSIGYTEEQSKALKELAKQAEETGTPINELIENLAKPSGRELIFSTIHNALDALSKVVQTFKDAWSEIFTQDKMANGLYNLLEGLNALSEKFVMSDEKADKLKRTLKGLFAIIDIISSVTGGALKFGIKLIAKLLGMVDVSVLDVTASVGDMIVKFRDWLFENSMIAKALSWVADTAKVAADAIKKWLKAFKELPEVQKLIEKFKNSFENFKKIGKNIVEGLKNGLEDGIKSIPGVMIELGNKILTTLKNILGIHSPSTKGYRIGVDFILGVLIGLKDAVVKVWNFLKDFGKKIIEFFGTIPWDKLFAAGVTVGLFATLTKLANAIETIAAPFAGLGSIFSSVAGIISTASEIMEKSTKNIQKVLKSFAKVLRSFAFSINAKALKDIAIALAILVGSVIALTFVNTEKLKSAVGVVVVLAIVLGFLAFALSKMSKISLQISKDGINLDGLKTTLLSLGVTLLLLAAAIKMVGSLEPDQAKRGFFALAGMIAALGIFIAAYGKFVKGKAAQNIDKLGDVLLKIAAALAIMAFVLKLTGSMSESELEQGSSVLMGFAVILGAVAYLQKYLNISKNIDKLGNALIKMAVAMGLMVFVVKLASHLSGDEIEKAADPIFTFIAIFAGLALVAKLAGDSTVKGLGTALLAMSASMLILAGVIKILAGMSEQDIEKGKNVIWFFAGVVAGLALVCKLVGKDTGKISATIITMSAAIAILAGVAIILGWIDLAALAKGVIAVGILSAMMALMIHAAKGVQNCMGSIIGMAVAIGVMAVAVAALSFIDGSKLAGAVAALSVLMGMFALMEKAAPSVKGGMGAIIAMTVAIAVLAGALYLVAQLPIEQALGAAGALSILMLTMSASLAILKYIGKDAKSALLGVVALLALCVGPLLLLVGILLAMSDVQNAITNAIALAGLAAALSLVLIPLSLVGALVAASKGATLLGIVALLAMWVPLRALVNVLRSMQDVQNATVNAMALIALLSAMGDVLVKVSLLAPLAILGVAALTALTAFMVGFGVLVAGIGDLVDNFPDLEKKIDKGIPIFEKLANGIGSIIGNFASGFADKLPEIGSSLSNFMEKADTFISGASAIDEKLPSGVKALAKAILILTATDIVQGIMSWLTDGSSIADFATRLEPLGKAMAKFGKAVSGVNTEQMKNAAEAAEALATLAHNLPRRDGWAQTILGSKEDLEGFGNKLVYLGRGIRLYGLQVKNLPVEEIKKSAEAAEALATLAHNLPRRDGLAQTILGSKDLEGFGNKLVYLGRGIRLYGLQVKNLPVEEITKSAEAAEALTTLAKSLPRSDGFWQKVIGEKDLKTFGEKLKTFGEKMVEYGTSISKINSNQISESTNSFKTLVDFTYEVKDIDYKGLETFGKKLNSFVDDISSLDFNSTQNVANAVQSIVELSGKIASIDTSSFDLFSTTISNMVKNLSDIDTSGLGSLTTSLTNIANSGINSFVQTISGESNKLTTAGASIVTNLISGIKSGSSSAKSAFSAVLDDIIKTAPSYYILFYGFGTNIAQGLADGINYNAYKVKNAADAMAEIAEEIVRTALDINSPSKVFRAIAYSIPEGFAQGIDRRTWMVEDSAASMADSAVNNTKSILSRIVDTINSDVDTQPTIRPVVDLSDVTDSANSINGLFTMTPSIGVMSNIGAISSMMNRNQNRGNDDVVSAIDALSKRLGNTSGDTYNINGLTYDDGSNITDAVKTIIRAARIERRT